MSTKTYSVLVTINNDDPRHPAFMPGVLADVIVGALEQGLTCVVGGVADVRVSPVNSAMADAFPGDLFAIVPGLGELPPYDRDRIRNARRQHYLTREDSAR